ncbi:mucin-5B-like [Pelodytes ibericus]
MADVVSLLLWTLCLIPQTAGQQKLVRVQKTDEAKAHCTTWGKFHFKTFDGTSYTFPGTCQYTFASNCHSTFPDFDVKIQRVLSEEGNRVYFTAIIESITIEIKEEGITVDGDEISLPYTKRSVVIDDTCENFKITSRIGVTLTWNWGDDLKLELDDIYKGRTCGLCSSFDDTASNDLSWKGFTVSPILFGNIQKTAIDPDDCPDIPDVQNDEIILDGCQQQHLECENVLSSMGNCKDRLHSYQDYLKTCTEDMCSCASNNKTECLCSTLNQFSKECVLGGGHPGSWRRPDLCFKICPKSMEYFECVSPCVDSCSNPAASKLCNEHCTEGCSCPPGTLLDDVHHHKECVIQRQCPCVHSEEVYNPGESYSTACHHCICIFGQWACTQLPCSGNCSLTGGSHISTFDEKEFTFHGNCQYVVSKDTKNRFAIIAKIIQCGMSETVTCLNAVHINIGKVTIKICYCGNVYINNFITLLPKIKDGIILYKPSSYFINVVTPFGLSVLVQVKPVFQLFITVNSTFQNETIGLCGNFNGIEADDLQTVSGVVEESASAFSNSWKSQASCSDIPDHYDNPCSKSISKDEYAKHWCSLLINTTQIFAQCHPHLDPTNYLKYCMYDVCNSEHSEDSLCMWLSVYARDCSYKGVPLWGWRQIVCDPKGSCPETMEFTYNPRQCNFSCLSLSEPDPICKISSTLTEGCSCPMGTYMTSNEMCVPPEKCPCNYKGREIPAGQMFKVHKTLCKCIRGILECPNKDVTIGVCKPPMYHVDCRSGSNAVGSQCQKSCRTQDMQCYSEECLPGCVCPAGSVSDDKGGCIPPSQCPCMYSGKFYSTGENITLPCQMCTCFNRTWDCKDVPCHHTCSVFGNGHYSTFDGSTFHFSGDCDYVLVQDFCPGNNNDGSFRIILENIACDKPDTVCRLSIKVYFKKILIELFEGRVEETGSDTEKDNSYVINMVGMYMVLKTNHGLILTWDQKTIATVQLSESFKEKICGLCGNFDGSSSNDFTSSWNSLEENESVFAESWKVKQGCKSGSRTEPCLENPAKLPWAQKHCSLIVGEVFAPCHAKVSPIPFYDSCVSDACSCTEGGDCECLCTSLAAYAAACGRNNICIAWRTPDLCPLFCDYFNTEEHCEWHYKSCGMPCMVTCTNPTGKCNNQTEKLEGCYPVCSEQRAYYDENKKLCVPVLNCTTCDAEEKLCDKKSAECLCCYNRTTYRYLEKIFTGLEERTCEIGYCGTNGEIVYTKATDGCETIPTASTTKRTSHTETPIPEGVVTILTRPPTKTAFPSTPGSSRIFKTTHHYTPSKAHFTKTSTPYSKLTTRKVSHATPMTISHSSYSIESSKQPKVLSTSAVTPSNAQSPSGIRSTHLKSSRTHFITTSKIPMTYSELSQTTKTTQVVTPALESTHTILTKPNVTLTRLSTQTALFTTSKLLRTTERAETKTVAIGTKIQTAGKTEQMSSTSQTTRVQGDDCLLMRKQDYMSKGDCKSQEKTSVNYCSGRCTTSSWYDPVSQLMSQNCSCCMETKKSSQEVLLHCPGDSNIVHTYILVEECSCVQIKCHRVADTKG